MVIGIRGEKYIIRGSRGIWPCSYLDCVGGRQLVSEMAAVLGGGDGGGCGGGVAVVVA